MAIRSGEIGRPSSVAAEHPTTVVAMTIATSAVKRVFDRFVFIGYQYDSQCGRGREVDHLRGVRSTIAEFQWPSIGRFRWTRSSRIQQRPALTNGDRYVRPPANAPHIAGSEAHDDGSAAARQPKPFSHLNMAGSASFKLVPRRDSEQNPRIGVAIQFPYSQFCSTCGANIRLPRPQAPEAQPAVRRVTCRQPDRAAPVPGGQRLRPSTSEVGELLAEHRWTSDDQVVGDADLTERLTVEIADIGIFLVLLDE